MTSDAPPSIRWDPDALPESASDPETDATPASLLFIAREAWLLAAPDLDQFADRGVLSRDERAAILFWLAPLERLVRAILFLLAPRELRTLQALPQAIREVDADAPASSDTRRHYSSHPASPSASPRFRYWPSRPPETHIVFDFDWPETEQRYLDWLAARNARRGRARIQSVREWTAAPLARRMLAVLDVLNDPGRHADRLTALLRRHRPAFSFASPRPPRRFGPQAPGAHALCRALDALRADLEAFIGPPEPYHPSG